MRIHLTIKPLALAAALMCAAGANAGPLSQADLARLVERLNARVERLEQRNTELERELRGGRSQPVQATIEQRMQALETQQEQVTQSLESNFISEREPELTTRLKAVEMQASSALSAARKISALDGVSAGLSLSTVAQKSFGVANASSQLNYRGDAFVTLPLSTIGDVDQKVFAQFRLGQGAGLSSLPTFASSNATAFQLGGSMRPDDSAAVLAQVWYQATIPLPFGGYKPRSKETLEVNFGKMDPFVFFDQNAIAGDETRQFLNSAFVHNPLLDAGGDIGVDANGFTPGLRLSYGNATSKPQTWRMSLGVFGAGDQGANFQRSLSAPLLMLQAETEQRMLDGLPGTYRIYAWRNPQAAHFDSGIAGAEQHTGWGLSVDQRVGDGISLFGRFGYQMAGNVPFDRALTLGAEFNGSYWDRGGDSIGLAGGWLNASRDYRDFLTAAGTRPDNAELVSELYYRWRISKEFELSPSLQYIGNPGSDGGAKAIKLVSLRAQINY